LILYTKPGHQKVPKYHGEGVEQEDIEENDAGAMLGMKKIEMTNTIAAFNRHPTQYRQRHTKDWKK
jgi:hypothetical protein